MRTFLRVLALVAMALGVIATPAFAQGTVLIREVVSREISLHVGGVESSPVKEAVSREISFSVEPGRAGFAEVISREYDVVVVTDAAPPVVTGLTVASSPTGDSAVLDWSAYNQWAVGDIVRFEIYLSDSGPITSVAGLTPFRTVGAGSTSLTLAGLTPFRDHFFAIVAVDALGHFTPTVNYSAAYVVSPQAVSREVSLFIGDDRSYAGLPLLSRGSAASVFVPTDAALGATWRQPAFVPAGWTAGDTGVGFGFQAGITVRVVKQNTAQFGNVNDLATVDALLAAPEGSARISEQYAAVLATLNLLGDGGDGHYGGNTPVTLADRSHYAVQATGFVMIPAAGEYTFGLNSDDGGRIKIDGVAVMVDDSNHGPSDHLGTVTLTAGLHAFEAVMWEQGGGDEVEFYAAPGALSGWTSAFALVGDTANGGLAATTSLLASSGDPNPLVRTNIEAQMRNVNASVYVRQEFPVTDPASLAFLSMKMRYADGFVAYLNGTEVARRNAPGSLAFNSSATAMRTLQETVTPETIDLSAFVGLLVPGTNVLAIQGLNDAVSDGTFLLLPEIFGGTFSPGRAGYQQLVSREVDVLIVTAAAPPAIVGATVLSSPSGDAATIDWSAYNQWAIGDIVRFDIYLSDAGAFSDVTGRTPYASIGAGATSLTLTGLTPGRDHFFAVVAVDGLGNFTPAVNYAAAYVLSPQAVSRELSLFVGGEPVPPFREIVSREMSIVVPDSAVPAPVTGVGSGFAAGTSGSAFGGVDLDWTSYNELAQNDVVAYRVYVGTNFFDTVIGLTPFQTVQSGRQRHTVTGLTGNGIYHFAVVAVDALGGFDPTVRSFSAQASISGVGEVVNLVGTSGANAITYAWEPPVDAGPFLRGYRVYFHGSTVPVELAPGVNSWTATGLQPGTGYNFRITTLDPFGGESGGTSLLGATLLANPANVRLTARSGQVVLLWNASVPTALVSYYEVYRSAAAFTNIGAATKIGAGPATELTLGSFAAVTGLHYAVVAVNVLGGSDPAVVSVQANQQTQSIDFPQPTVAGSAPVALSATASSGLPVSFEALPLGRAVIDTSGAIPRLVPLSGGRVTVTASQDGNANFWPADAVSRVVRQLPLFTSFTASGQEIAGGMTLRNIDEELRAIALDADGISRAEFSIRQIGNGAFISLGVDLIPGNGFSANLPLDVFLDGAYELRVHVETPEGIANEISRFVALQLAPPPAPVLTAPADGLHVEVATITVSGTTVRASQVFILRNGVQIAGPLDPNAGGVFSTQIELLPGANSLTVRASNRAGTGAASAPRTITLNPGPVIAGTTFRGVSLAEGATVAGSGRFGVEATDSDGLDRAEFFYKPAAGVFTIALGTDANGADGFDALWNVENLSDGPFDLTARIFDRLGASSEITRRVSLALATPQAPVIASPIDGTALSAASVIVTGSAAVFPTLRIYRNGERVFSGAASASGTFSAAVPLVEGDNVIYAESANRAGASTPSNLVTVTRMLALPTLNLALAQPAVAEGGTVAATLTLSAARTQPTVVTLASTPADRLSFSGTVTIAAGATSVGVTLQALQNQALEQPREILLLASSAVTEPGSAVLQVLDDDQPAITLLLDRPLTSEGAGAQAAMGVILFDRAFPFPLNVSLTAQPAGDLVLPAQVQVPANGTSATFSVAAVDNALLDGQRDVVIRARLLDPAGGPPLKTSDPVTLTVSDDDGPSLALTVDRTLLVEGANPAATATVTRHPVTAQPLTVTFQSSDTTELATPVAVTIPANAASTSVVLQAPADGQSDGSQACALTANAVGHSPAVLHLVVTDLQKPDLTVALVDPPAGAETEAWTDVRVRLLNQGATDAQGPFSQRISLSTDPLPGGDLLLAQENFSGRLLAGGAIEQILRVRMPREAGRYWLIVETDASGVIAEVLEDNNRAISATPLDLEAAYTSTLAIVPESVPAATPIPITGHAQLRAGGPAAFVLVNIQITNAGVTRIIAALTNSAGNFTTSFTPNTGEGGLFEFAAAHPGVPSAAVQDQVSVLGLRADPAVLSLNVPENGLRNGELTLVNPSDAALSGLQIVAENLPADLQFEALPPATTLAAHQQMTVPYTFRATTPQPRREFRLRVSATGGVSTTVPVFLTVDPLTARLIATPRELVAGMLRGASRVVDFTLKNDGQAATGPLAIQLPGIFPWLQLTGPATLPALAPGESRKVSLQLTPPPDLDLTEYNGNLAINSTGTSLSLPFRFRAVSNARGSLAIDAVDEFYFFGGNAEKVAGAAITLVDAVSGAVVTDARTGTDGRATISDLPEGYYRAEVTAIGHSPARTTFFVEAGTTTTRQIFISRNLVEYTWTVEQVQVEDRYKVHIETTFETNVPAPVVTVTPENLDLSPLTAVGQSIEVVMKVENHGLIAARSGRFSFSEHPWYRFELPVSDLGQIPARSSVLVPLRVTRIGPAPAPAPALGVAAPPPPAPAPCSIDARFTWDYLCGIIPVVKLALISVNGVAGECPQPPRPQPPSGGGGPGGGGGAGGGIVTVTVPAPTICDCNLLLSIFDPCLSFDASIKLPDMAGKLVSKLTAVLPSPVQVRDVSITPGVEGKICLDCCEDGSVGLKGEGRVFLDIKVVLLLGRGVEGEIPWTAGGGWADLNVSVDGFVGAQLTLNGSAEINGFFDECTGESDLCAEGRLGGSLALGGQFDATVSATAEGATFSGNIRGQLTLTGNAEGWLRGCLNSGFDAGACAGLTGTAEASGQLTAPGLQPRSISIGGSHDFGQVGTCADAPSPPPLPFLAPGFLPPPPPVDPFFEHLPASQFLRSSNELKAMLIPANTGGVCATVRLSLDQELVLTRTIFRANLNLRNNSDDAITGFAVDLDVRDAAGQPANDRFAIRLIEGTNGQPVLPRTAADLRWSLSPLDTAALTGDTRYTVGGTLRYTQSGRTISALLNPIAITVRPDAALTVKYFHERNVFSDDPFTLPVEPAIPYALGVLIENTGAGTARNLRITSAQPQIIENEKGLLVDFRIIATQVEGQPLVPSLTADFGDIGPGEIKLGSWLFTSSLHGFFRDYTASFEHLDGLGETRLSLIRSVEIHEMLHQVAALGAAADGLADFLVNDTPDARWLPDTLYFSQGGTAPVSVVELAQVSGTLSPTQLSLGLTATVPTGWIYLRVPEPANGQYVLSRVLRSDGVEIPFGVNAWVTDRTFNGQGQRPVYENILHLFDGGSTGSYTLVYEPRAAPDTQTPTSHVRTLAAQSAVEFPVEWEGADDRGVAFYDLYVSVNGGPFAPWLERTRDTAAIYAGELGKSYAFYSRATDAAGHTEAAPGTADTATSVTMQNLAPTLATVADQEVGEGQTLILDLVGADPDGRGDLLTYAFATVVPPGLTLNSQTGRIQWATGEADGGRDVAVQVRVTDSGVPAQAVTRSFHIRVLEQNQPPALAAVAPLRVAPGHLLSIQLEGQDADLPGQTLRYRFASPTPATMFMDAVTGLIQWQPGVADADRTVAFTVAVTDSGVPPLETAQNVSIIVDPANLDRPPQFYANAQQLWFIGSSHVLDVAAFDPDGDALTMTLNAAGLPGSVAFSSTAGTGRGRLTWDTTGAAPGLYTPPVKAIAGAAQAQYSPVIKLVRDNAYWRWAEGKLGSLADVSLTDPNADPDGDGTGNIHEWTFLRDPRTKDATLQQVTLDGPYDGNWFYANLSVHRRRGSDRFVTLVPQAAPALGGNAWQDLPPTDWDATLDPNGDDDDDPETEEVSVQVLFQLTLDGVNDRKFIRLKSTVRPNAP